MTGRLIVAVLFLVGTVCAQFQSESSEIVRRLRVRIAYGDHAPCDPSTRIVLTGAMGFAVAQGSVSGECVAEFSDVPSGRYRVTISGADAANADEGEVEVHAVISQELEVRARHTRDSDPIHLATAASFISAAELGVPSSAAKEFEKAGRSIAKQDWAKATERLQKGLAIYPRFAAGYNNLGAVYFHQGSNMQAREALQKAVALDDHLAPVYVNLARLSFVEKDYPAAESLLTKAMSLGTAENADELFLLAYAQLIDHHLDQAVQTSHEGHAGKLTRHAYLHLIAANAYEQQHKIVDSMAELELYLAEEPGSPQAEKVRQALARFRAQSARQ